MVYFGCSLRKVNHGGQENNALTGELLERFNIQNELVADNHWQTNGPVGS